MATFAPGVNDGASLTAVTWIVKVIGADMSLPPFAVPPSSCSVTVTMASPFAFGAGANVSTPAGEIDGCTLKRALLLFVAVNETVCVDSSGGPAGAVVAHAALYAPESSITVTSPPLVNDGASLTAMTVMVNVTGADWSTPPSAVPVTDRKSTRLN